VQQVMLHVLLWPSVTRFRKNRYCVASSNLLGNMSFQL
jgi:hypothetical protein